MNKLLAILACTLAGASVASAQDRDHPRDDLHRKFERSMKDLDRKFQQERERLELEFRRAMEKFGAHPERKQSEKHRGAEPRHPKKDARPHEKKAEKSHRQAEEHRERAEEHRKKAEDEFSERFRRAIPPDFVPKLRDFFEKFRGRGEGPRPRRDDHRESLDRIQEQLRGLEKRIEGFRGDMPRFRKWERFMPKDFKFDFGKDFWRNMPRFRDGEGKPRNFDFKFEFRRPDRARDPRGF